MGYLQLEHKTQKFIAKNQLLHAEQPLLLALSGGLDSTVLLHLLHRLHYRVHAAHCNFGLRGKESDEDESFCEKLCTDLKIPFTSRRFDTEAYAARNQESIQSAARALRYRWFMELLHLHGYQAIATAHHCNDNTESVLMDTVFGRSAERSQGIPIRNGKIVRPIWFAMKAELFTYAQEKNIPWREDSSNAAHSYTRNLFRLQLLPELEKVNPGLHHSIARLSRHQQSMRIMAETGAEQVLSGCIRNTPNGTEIQLKMILEHPAREYLVWKALSAYGFDGDILDQLNESVHSSGSVFSNTAYTITVDRNRLLITKNEHFSTDYSMDIKPDTVTHLPDGGSISCSVFDYRGELHLPARNDEAWLDADCCTSALQVRNWRDGDHFQPLGMSGFKKLSDYFIDRKIPLPEKKRIPLLTCGDDILWVVGERIDQRYRITEKTKSILRIRYSKPD